MSSLSRTASALADSQKLLAILEREVQRHERKVQIARLWAVAAISGAAVVIGFSVLFGRSYPFICIISVIAAILVGVALKRVKEAGKELDAARVALAQAQQEMFRRALGHAQDSNSTPNDSRSRC